MNDATHILVVTASGGQVSWRIECSDVSACPGWIECGDNHAGFDPYREDSPAAGRFEDVRIHGERHVWTDDHGWCVPDPRCPVKTSRTVIPDGAPVPLTAGRYLLAAGWDEDGEVSRVGGGRGVGQVGSTTAAGPSGCSAAPCEKWATSGVRV